MAEPRPPADQTEQPVPGTFVVQGGECYVVLQGGHLLPIPSQQQAVGAHQSPAVIQTFQPQQHHAYAAPSSGPNAFNIPPYLYGQQYKGPVASPYHYPMYGHGPLPATSFQLPGGFPSTYPPFFPQQTYPLQQPKISQQLSYPLPLAKQPLGQSPTPCPPTPAKIDPQVLGLGTSSSPPRQLFDDLRQAIVPKPRQDALTETAVRQDVTITPPKGHHLPKVPSTFRGKPARGESREIPNLPELVTMPPTTIKPPASFRKYTESNSRTSHVAWINSAHYHLPYTLDFKRCFMHLLTVQGCPNGSKCESSHLPPQKDERDYLMAIGEGDFLRKIVKMWILRHVRKGADTLSPTPVGGQAPSAATLAAAPKAKWTLAPDAVVHPLLKAVYNEWAELGVEQRAVDDRHSMQLAQQPLQPLARQLNPRPRPPLLPTPRPGRESKDELMNKMAMQKGTQPMRLASQMEPSSRTARGTTRKATAVRKDKFRAMGQKAPEGLGEIQNPDANDSVGGGD